MMVDTLDWDRVPSTLLDRLRLIEPTQAEKNQYDNMLFSMMFNEFYTQTFELIPNALTIFPRSSITPGLMRAMLDCPNSKRISEYRRLKILIRKYLWGEVK